MTKEGIKTLRSKSLRGGIWFRALNRAERGIVDLMLKYIDAIRSAALMKALRSILAKLSDAVEHTFAWTLVRAGRPIAEMMSRMAVALGVEGAEEWKDDPAYIECLGINSMSTNP